MKPFIYNGMRLATLRKLTQSEVNQGLNLPFTSIGVSNYQNVPHLNIQKDIPYNFINFTSRLNWPGLKTLKYFYAREWKLCRIQTNYLKLNK